MLPVRIVMEGRGKKCTSICRASNLPPIAREMSATLFSLIGSKLIRSGARKSKMTRRAVTAPAAAAIRRVSFTCFLIEASRLALPGIPNIGRHCSSLAFRAVNPVQVCNLCRILKENLFPLSGFVKNDRPLPSPTALCSLALSASVLR